MSIYQGHFLKQTATKLVAALLMVLIPGLTFMHVLAHKRQRKEVKRYLERTVGMEVSEDLFLPNTAEYAHLKKGSEIILGENKYDLLKVVVVPGGYRVKAFNDKIEKALENQIAQQTERGHGGSSHAKPLWFDKLHWGLWDKETSVPLPLDKEQEFLKVVGRDVLCGFREVSVPPPQGCEYQQREFYS
ncbi:MAG: hypothetical protein ACKOI1_07895 [Bacteroidota bacterium]